MAVRTQIAAGDRDPATFAPTQDRNRVRDDLLRRRPVQVAVGVLVVLGAIAAAVLGGIGAGAAVVFGALLVLLAVTLPGTTYEGVVVGLLTLAAAITSWTHTSQPKLTWGVLVVQGVIFVVWTFPWFRDLRALPRMGTFWLGVLPWALGAAGALISVALGVAAQRIVYGGMAVLVLLVFLRARRRTGMDPSIGLIAGILLGLAVLAFAGSHSLFALSHYAPPGPWGAKLNGRFWGGPLAVIHPNGLALAALLVSVRIAPDKKFAPWQRFLALAISTILLYATQSRTGVLAAGFASAGWAVGVLWASVRRRGLLDTLRTRPGVLTVASAALPLVLCVAVLGAAGGRGFVLKQRYGAVAVHEAEGTDQNTNADNLQGGVSAASSGRTANWSAILREWQTDPVVQQSLGTTDNARGYLLLHGTMKNQPKLTSDNAPISELRRAGVLGVLTFVLGFALLLLNLIRRRGLPLWWTLVVLAGFATIGTSDQVLGGTGTTMWAMLIAGEVATMRRLPGRQPIPPTLRRAPAD